VVRTETRDNVSELSETTNESIINIFDEKADSKNPTRVKALQAVLVALGYKLQ
jgi:hypothetical protein